MACVENAPAPMGNDDSEMEEGEIVDDLDELSDISSEEEFLLRQRLQVLENYNNVLERKEAKRSSLDLGKKPRREPFLDLSEISRPNSNNGSAHFICKDIREQRYSKSHCHKQKKRRDIESHYDLGKSKDYKKRPHRKKVIISESSDESDDEYRNKRRKLENAVAVKKDKIDTSSLRARLNKMLRGKQNQEVQNEENENIDENKQMETQSNPIIKDNSDSLTTNSHTSKDCDEQKPTEEIVNLSKESCELIDLCTDDEVRVNSVNIEASDTLGVVIKSDKKNNVINSGDSDEDLELLRQHALKTKASYVKTNEQDITNEAENNKLVLSEDEDSDTEELRMICLKSALLKKAIERKRKQKLKKKLSQSFSLQDDLMAELVELEDKVESDNNTDIESVDMDIGSDIDEKIKESSNDTLKVNKEQNTKLENAEYVYKGDVDSNMPKEDELEEDEDLLRAKLLTSLSKNLPNLVDPNIIQNVDDMKSVEPSLPSFKSKVSIPEQKRLIINLGESDSDSGEHEATKNLTKMHMKLSEQSDFQHKLDIFLKSARTEVEKTKLPDVVQQKSSPKSPEKFVAKVVNHLPRSEQIEYRNLVKRMAELEKIKHARQSSINSVSELSVPVKDTLKPRNVSVDTVKMATVNNLEEQIALSRKNIAEESAKMLKLKEEATKLSQKYKIVATELRNITTAITLNKKVQRSAQIRLSKIRAQHQRLLNSLILSKHSKDKMVNYPNLKLVPATRSQKENDPLKEEYKNPVALKSVKVSVINDFKEEKSAMHPRLSVQIDVNSNKKTIKLPESSDNERNEENGENYVSTEDPSGDDPNDMLDSRLRNDNEVKRPIIINMRGTNGVTGNDCSNVEEMETKNVNDYESPLQALNYSTWSEDPNGVLCPFDIDGNCKDADCKYLHPKLPSQ